MKIGLLALQGAVRPHAESLAGLGVIAAEVRTPADLQGIDALILPGGESTTVSKLIDTSGLRDPLAECLAEGLPVLGTCAGMILLSDTVIDGRPDQRSFGVIDIAVRRNAFGRQIDSFEVDLTVTGLDTPFPAVFIRAPFVEQVGTDVEVLASVDQHPVLCRQGQVVVSAFHPELADDSRIHELWLESIN